MHLRPYQRAALDRARAAFRAGRRCVLLVAPTGAGKTVVVSAIAHGHIERGGRVLVIVHRRELIAQTERKLRDAGIESVGVVAAGWPSDPGAPVQIASVQTLLARGGSPPPATLLVFDEAHHFVAEQWGSIARQYAQAKIVGVTATPERADGTPLGDLFDAMVVVASVRELTDLGFLVPCDVIAPPRPTRTLCEDPIAAWRKHADGRPTVIFASSVDAARELADRFTGEGVRAACVDGGTASRDRDARLDAFASGALDVLTNVFVLTEGWDAPRAEVCLLARGCSSTGTYLQTVGRVLRPCEGKAGARLIDLRGAVHEHGLPDDDRVFSLEGRAISGGAAPVKTCPVCSLVCPLAVRACLGCGYAFPPASCDPDIVGLTKIERDDRERGYFAGLVEKARARGYKLGWAGYQFRQKFGRFPAKLLREEIAREGMAA